MHDRNASSGCDKDPTTRRMHEDILAEEEEHAEELRDWLEA